MVYNKVIHWQSDKPKVEEKTPYEVEQLQHLIGSSGWGLIVDSLKLRQEEYKSKIIAKRPAWVTEAEKLQAYDFMVRTNDTIIELDNLIDLPKLLIEDYTTWNFNVDMTQ